jgi:hypothetical protein
MPDTASEPTTADGNDFEDGLLNGLHHGVATKYLAESNWSGRCSPGRASPECTMRFRRFTRTSSVALMLGKTWSPSHDPFMLHIASSPRELDRKETPMLRKIGAALAGTAMVAVLAASMLDAVRHR